MVKKNEQNLTPHTLRLIKLITSSSLTSISPLVLSYGNNNDEDDDHDDSNEHVKHAISLLSNIASKSHPILLWDILARLYSSLTKCKEDGGIDGDGRNGDCLIQREYIALAMEHVAKFIPSSERRHFLMDSTVLISSSSNSLQTEDCNDDENHKEYKAWLKIKDFLPDDTNLDDTNQNKDERMIQSEDCDAKWTTLNQILIKGRLLLSSSGKQYTTTLLPTNLEYETEQIMLSSIDASTLASSSTHEQSQYIKKRIALQRSILARRLGFGGILSREGVGGNDGLNAIISDQDLIDGSTITSENQNKSDTEKENGNNIKGMSARQRNMHRLKKRKVDQNSCTVDETASRSKKVNKLSKSNQTKKDDIDYKSIAVKDTDTNNDGDDNKNRNDEDDEDDEAGQSTIRNLLLLSLSHQPTTNTSVMYQSDNSLISHHNPQMIMATDMIYNSFHPSWHIRHGSLLGLLSLLKAWQSSFKDRNNNDKTVMLKHFGAWPEDICCRCLCILALDRFGDFAGHSIQTYSNPKDANNGDAIIFNDSVVGSAMSAPVREVAGQVLSLLLDMAPSNDIQDPCYQVLSKLTSYAREWEVRHGSMLAFKYIANRLRNEYRSGSDKWLCNQNIWDEVINHAIKGLKDSSDDVRGASAQVLYNLVAKHVYANEEKESTEVQSKVSHIISQCAQHVWAAINELCATSTCTLDLMKLFSQIVSTDSKCVLSSLGTLKEKNSSRTTDHLLAKLNSFLHFNDISVQLSCLNTLSVIVEPISITLSQSESKKSKRKSNKTMQVLCDLLTSLFLSFLKGTNQYYDSTTSKKNDSNFCMSMTMRVFDSLRCKAWSSIIDAAQKTFCIGDSPIVQKTILNMIGELINHNTSQGLGSSGHMLKSKISTWYQILTATTNAIAELCDKIRLGPIIDMPVFLCIFCMLESPWLDICECGCVLLKSLSQRDVVPQALVTEFQQFLAEMLETHPNCILVDHYTNSEVMKNDQSGRDIYRSTMLTILNVQRQHDADIDVIDWVRLQRKTVVQIWSNVLNTFGIDFSHESNIDLSKIRMSKYYMRLSASIAGAIASFGVKNLPKLTSVIRAMMTSIKNEELDSRSKTSCSDIASMLESLSRSSQQQHKRAQSKILEKLCTLSCSDPQFVTHPVGWTITGWKASQTVLQFVVKSLKESQDLSSSKIIWQRIQCLQSIDPASIDERQMKNAITLFSTLSVSFTKETSGYAHVVDALLNTLVLLACNHDDSYVRKKALVAVENICLIHPSNSVPAILPLLTTALKADRDDACRLGACTLMNILVEALGTMIVPYVHNLLPIAMSLMTDPIEQCSKIAAKTFAILVRVAPLVPTAEEQSEQLIDKGHNRKKLKPTVSEAWEDESFRKVVDHLIHGKPLPPLSLSKDIEKSLSKGGITLRRYQMEGLSWMNLLRSLRLNGALCDEMGLGKTIQALVAISMAHYEQSQCQSPTSQKQCLRSLIVCPSSVVGHWMNEISRVDSSMASLKPLRYVGTSRREEWRNQFNSTNVVVTSYSVLRSDITTLGQQPWKYCILDEGHLIKNPKTATAKAAQCLRSQHKLLLSGSPVQNSINELWAVFNWLMPNYLGSNSHFSKHFGREIGKSQLPGASSGNIRRGMKKLKVLHQQVLPFVLRREKDSVLQQLPPKIITDVPCSLVKEQASLYNSLCVDETTRNAIELFNSCITDSEHPNKVENIINRNALKSLIRLRMICTHPILLDVTGKGNIDTFDSKLARYDASGKLCVLCDLLRNGGIAREDLTAADNDHSLIYVNNNDTIDVDIDIDSLGNFERNEECRYDEIITGEKQRKGSKCLIFAQFTHSLDVVEELLFKPIMPSLKYVRLDGRVEPSHRDALIERFVSDDTVTCMLLTTKVGSLGLNLQAASTVIFLEPDYNPHVDLQAMDRVHRIGQQKTVNVYRLVTTNSIEEKIMMLQKSKLAMSDAIVNTENSTLFSLGTDRLLDLFDTNDS